MTKSNVNPDHYKTAGRERQGEDIVQEIHKQKLKQEEARQQSGNQNFIPGTNRPTEVADDASGGKRTVGQVNESANSSSSK